MATNKIGTKTTEEFMSDYVPVYQPLYPLFMAKAQQHADVVGDVNFKRATTVGDIRAKHITPKDTELKQVAVGEGKKTFKKYFLGNQYTVSHMQTQEDTESVIAEVLDENHKLADEMLMSGEGTANNNVVNNGLFFSADPNHVTNASVEIDSTNRLLDLHAKIMVTIAVAKKLAGEKIIIFYGANMLAQLNSLHATTNVPFRKTLEDALGAGFTIAEAPENAVPAGEGWIIVNMDRIKVHYLVIPSVDGAGSNDEKKYNWVNFIMGSFMVDVLTKGAVIRQPATFEA